MLFANYCLHSNANFTCFCFREYEVDSSTVLEQFFEKDQSKTFKLITRKLSTWDNQNLFLLAEKVDGIDFVRNDCCQTYLDKTWIGRTSECDWANIKVIVQFTLRISVVFTKRISCCCRAEIARRYILLYICLSVCWLVRLCLSQVGVSTTLCHRKKHLFIF